MVLAAAVIVLGAATAGLFALNEIALSWYYQLAWWSYIVGVDDLNRRLRGRSLLRDDPLRFAALCLGSVAWWTLFEAINLRLGNWYYVMDHPERWIRWTGGVVAFATVLPGIAETRELLESVRWPRSWRVQALAWGPRADAACAAFGVAFLVLPLLWPEAFFPLTWGSVVLLLEPWNRRHARQSFLRDLEAGEVRGLATTLAAGFVCGGLWELWNYWARTKWIYTVPGFEEWKLFEMPLAGFLGFPPFALECVVVVRFVEGVLGRLPRSGPTRRLAAGTALVGAAALTLAVFSAADAVTVDSFYVPVRSLSVLPEAERRRLAEAGLSSPEKLLRALSTPASREEWSRRTGLAAAPLEAAFETVALVMHRGLGQERASQLGRLGIRGRADLARWSPAELAQRLREQGQSPRDRFLERRARVWVRGRAEGPRVR